MTPIAWNTGPIATLEEARKEARTKKDWFMPIVLSAIHLERYGHQKIENYLKLLKLSYSKKDLENLSLREIALCLLAIKKIDDKEYNTILEINRARNRFIHRKRGYTYLIGTPATKKYDPFVGEAIRILKEKLDVKKLVVF